MMIFGLRIDAQTLKNIHRHNQPVLRIPTHLIDKVETAEVNGAQVLQVRQLNGYVSEIPLAQIDSITHSEGEAVDPAQLGNLRTASVMGVVTGPTGAPEMNAIVRSPYGGEQTETDQNGVFFLNNILVYDKLGYITITKPGFHQGSRSFLPLGTGSNRLNVQLLRMTQSGTFSAAGGGTVNSGLLQLSFPANAVTLNGQPFMDSVHVYAAALDPTSPAMFDQMPGELLGGLNDSLRLLRSFGMASVELRDANMNELALANGVSATLTFNIPTSLQAEAPQTIDWWSFDETLGYWKHEGEAQKQGNQYFGSASHFSWWNCDVPQNFNDFHGSVNTSDGTPISDAQVNVVTPNLGTGITYTNAEGEFSGRVPKNQLLTLNIYLTCETTSDWSLAYTEEILSTTEPILGQYEPASLDERFLITGSVTNCESQPVESGYVRIGSQIFLTNNGIFNIQVCQSGEYSIRGFDSINPDSLIASELFTFQIQNTETNTGNLVACSTVFYSVTDIDGNIYETALIGEQWWMTENLTTTRFSDGSDILATMGSGLMQLTIPAYSTYCCDPTYNITYGKLYNHFSVSDIRNVCPAGWHVPSLEEYNLLFDYLGGTEFAGGKLKSTNGWDAPNTGATNESGFNALPGGVTQTPGNWYSIGWNALFWTSSQFNQTNADFINLSKNNRVADSSNKPFQAGLSVRCVKD